MACILKHFALNETLHSNNSRLNSCLIINKSATAPGYVLLNEFYEANWPATLQLHFFLPSDS